MLALTYPYLPNGDLARPQLTQVTLHGSSHSEEMAEALTRSSLRFSFQDGRIEELCAAETDEAWVLNFKRGVLSGFQTSRTSPGKHVSLVFLCNTYGWHHQQKCEQSDQRMQC